MKEFSVGECVRFGWRTFRQRPLIFVGAAVVIAIASWLGGAIASAFGPDGTTSLIGALINIVVGILIGMGETAFFLKAESDPESLGIADLWHPRPFWKYVGATALTTLAIIAGLILLIIPGIIVALMLMFSCYFVIDKELRPVAAFKESRRITKGHLGTLFLLILAIIGINVLGLLALVIGLLVSIPVSMLATVHAYRTLSKMAPPTAA